MILTVSVLLILSGTGLCLKAQTDPAWQVNWVGQFPAQEAQRKKSFGDRVSQVVFGKKQQELLKPFNVLAADPDHFLLVDQGAGTLFINENGKMRESKGMKRVPSPLPSLVGIAGLPGGEVLLTDSRLNQVYLLADESLQIFTDAASFTQPTGIAYSEKTGEIWVVETGAHRITLLDREGGILRRIGERGSGEGNFNYPTFLWIDPSGRVYVVDSMNFRIQVFDSEGKFLFTFGENGDASGCMARPKGVATDSWGNIYVTDALFHVVQIFDSEGNFLSSFGEQGQEKGEFWMPAGIYIDKQNHIYVADSYNARIQVFQLEKN